jgi:hypothetical protein
MVKKSKSRRRKSARRYNALPDQRVLAIKAALKSDKSYGSQSRIARKFKVDQATICRIAKRKAYASVR